MRDVDILPVDMELTPSTVIILVISMQSLRTVRHGMVLAGRNVAFPLDFITLHQLLAKEKED